MDEMQTGADEVQAPENLNGRSFPHISFAVVSSAAIFILYMLTGSGLAFMFNAISKGMLAYVQGGAQIAVMLLPAILVMGFSPLGRTYLLRLRGRTTLRQWIAGIVGIFVFQIFVQGWAALQDILIPDVINRYLQAIDRELEGLYRQLLGSGSGSEMVLGFLVVALIPALAEEVLFRGLLQRSLEEVLSPKRAVWYTALGFALVHFHPLSLIPLLVIGIYLGVMAYSTQGLGLPIAAHFTNNAIAVASIYLNPGETGSIPRLEWWAAILVSMLGFGLTVIMMQVVVTDAPLAFQLNLGKYKRDDHHH